MAQIIIIEDSKEFNQLLSINLSTYIGAEVIPRDNADSAIELMNLLPKVDLIISKEKIGEEDTAKTIANYIKSENLETILIVLGNDFLELKKIGIAIQEINDWQKIITASANILGISQDELTLKMIPEYIPIPIDFFTSIESCPCDIFLRIKEGAQDFKYIKRVHAYDSYSVDMIQKYIEQGVKNLYIPKQFKKEFTNFLSNQLVLKLEMLPEDATIDDKISIIGNSFDIVKKQIIEMGFNSATIQLTESIIESIEKTYSNDPKVSTLLHKVLNAPSSLIYQLCHLTSVVAAECIKNILPENEQKDAASILTHAAFFNNIALSEEDELIKISSYHELENYELENSKWDLVLNHALISFEILLKHPTLPLIVSTVVKEHHGSINGKGFPEAIDPKLNQYSKIFLVAESFALELLKYRYKNAGQDRPAPIVHELYKRFESDEMKSIVKKLEMALKGHSV